MRKRNYVHSLHAVILIACLVAALAACRNPDQAVPSSGKSVFSQAEESSESSSFTQAVPSSSSSYSTLEKQEKPAPENGENAYLSDPQDNPGQAVDWADQRLTSKSYQVPCILEDEKIVEQGIKEEILGFEQTGSSCKLTMRVTNESPFLIIDWEITHLVVDGFTVPCTMSPLALESKESFIRDYLFNIDPLLQYGVKDVSSISLYIDFSKEVISDDGAAYHGYSHTFSISMPAGKGNGSEKDLPTEDYTVVYDKDGLCIYCVGIRRDHGHEQLELLFRNTSGTAFYLYPYDGYSLYVEERDKEPVLLSLDDIVVFPGTFSIGDLYFTDVETSFSSMSKNASVSLGFELKDWFTTESLEPVAISFPVSSVSEITSTSEKPVEQDQDVSANELVEKVLAWKEMVDRIEVPPENGSFDKDYSVPCMIEDQRYLDVGIEEEIIDLDLRDGKAVITVRLMNKGQYPVMDWWINCFTVNDINIPYRATGKGGIFLKAGESCTKDYAINLDSLTHFGTEDVSSIVLHTKCQIAKTPGQYSNIGQTIGLKIGSAAGKPLSFDQYEKVYDQDGIQIYYISMSADSDSVSMDFLLHSDGGKEMDLYSSSISIDGSEDSFFDIDNILVFPGTVSVFKLESNEETESFMDNLTDGTSMTVSLDDYNDVFDEPERPPLITFSFYPGK